MRDRSNQFGRAQCLIPCRPIFSKKCTPIGAQRITFQSGRSICKTIRCSKPRFRLEHIKPRLLGHWGTTTGLNFLYVHLNRLIKENDLNMIYVIGPGHGGPGIVAHSYLEGSYTERYPAIERSRNGLQRLFRQFSWPYGIPSHVSPETPGSIHEGGELGYSLAHAYGAAFDNPDLIVSCIIGDGEAETGALATSWHSNKFLNPARDGAVLPILHLNGFKIANPTVLARISRQELTELMRGYGYDPYFVEGDDPALVHQSLAGTLDRILVRICDIQNTARNRGDTEGLERPRWPMIVFRTPKEDLHSRITDCSQAGFAMAMDLSCHSFVRMARLSEPLMTDGGCLFPVTFYGSENFVEEYNLMGPVKAALESCVRYMAAELRTAAHPGPCAFSGSAQDSRGIGHRAASTLLERARARTPEHRLVSIEDVGNLATFLVSDGAAALTGNIAYVDAGNHVVG